jgi:5'-deoxynucleotidase YfbR-like HD superfamily hydrolase
LQERGCMQDIIWQQPLLLHHCFHCHMHSHFWDGHQDYWQSQSVAWCQAMHIAYFLKS